MFRPGTFFLKLAAKFIWLFQSDDVTKFKGQFTPFRIPNLCEYYSQSERLVAE